MDFVEILLIFDKLLIVLHSQVFLEYWVLAETQILLKPVKGEWGFLRYQLILMTRLNAA